MVLTVIQIDSNSNIFMSRLLFIAGFLFFSLYGCQQETNLSIAEKNPAEEHSDLKPAEQFFAQRLAPDQSFSTTQYSRALQQAAREKVQKSQSPGFDGFWTVRGPANVGARVNTIAVHPSNEEIIYIGYCSSF